LLLSLSDFNIKTKLSVKNPFSLKKFKYLNELFSNIFSELNIYRSYAINFSGTFATSLLLILFITPAAKFLGFANSSSSSLFNFSKSSFPITISPLIAASIFSLSFNGIFLLF